MLITSENLTILLSLIPLMCTGFVTLGLSSISRKARKSASLLIIYTGGMVTEKYKLQYFNVRDLMNLIKPSPSSRKPLDSDSLWVKLWSFTNKNKGTCVEYVEIILNNIY